MSPLLPHFIRLADRVAAEIELLCELLVHDRDERRARRIRAREFAAGEERHAEREKKPGPTVLTVRVRVGVRLPVSNPCHRHVLLQSSSRSTAMRAAATP